MIKIGHFEIDEQDAIAAGLAVALVAMIGHDRAKKVSQQVGKIGGPGQVTGFRRKRREAPQAEPFYDLPDNDDVIDVEAHYRD